jgi:hypothetical protein
LIFLRLGIDTVVSNFGWHKELSQFMKNNFIKAVSAGVLTLSMGVLPLTLSAQAQTTTDTGANTTSGTTWFGWFGW